LSLIVFVIAVLCIMLQALTAKQKEQKQIPMGQLEIKTELLCSLSVVTKLTIVTSSTAIVCFTSMP